MTEGTKRTLTTEEHNALLLYPALAEALEDLVEEYGCTLVQDALEELVEERLA